MKKILYFIILFVSIFVLSNSINAWSKYEVGEKVPYNGIDFYVIKDSDENNDEVTMLKAEPLSVEEVNEYGAGHVNMNVPSSESYYQTAYDNNGYGGMQYYSSSTCGYNGTGWVSGECKNDYASSEIKYVVDAWKAAKAPAATEVRLISKDEIETERKEYDPCGGCGAVKTGDFAKYNWMYNNNYWYWTNTPYTGSSSNVWSVYNNGALGSNSVNYSGSYGVVRPLITISKSVIEASNDQEEVDKEIDKETDKADKNTVFDKNNSEDINVITKTEDSKVSVNVPNTMQKISVVLIMTGIILITISIVIIVKNKDKLKNK